MVNLKKPTKPDNLLSLFKCQQTATRKGRFVQQSNPPLAHLKFTPSFDGDELQPKKQSEHHNQGPAKQQSGTDSSYQQAVNFVLVRF